jgi:hypothetical protein
MNMFDFIIIYLTCGAPFGVYYYLQNRNLPNNKFFFLKLIFNFFFWILFSISLVSQKGFFRNLFDYNFDKKVVLDSKREAEISAIRKFFETGIFKNSFQFSIYEFREIFDRYVGLTLETNGPTGEITHSVKDFCRISEVPNKKIAENCLHRRNRQRLFFHQKLARDDFWEITDKIINKSENRAEILIKLSRLIKILNDSESKIFFQTFSENSLQTIENKHVFNQEYDLWKTEMPQLSHTKPNSVNIKALTAKMNLFNKD